jgi:AraC-like DNA-binding protein
MPSLSRIARLSAGVPIRFNGLEGDDRAIVVIGNGGAVYTQVERSPRQYASIVFSPEIKDRGWPRSGTAFKVVVVSASAYYALRELTSQVTSLSSEFADPVECAAAAAAIRESLLAAVDHAFADAVDFPASLADEARQFKVFRDVEALLSREMGRALYSGDLARQVGVSVRTMHDAVKRYRGMSLHRYLRRRLWLVRKRLIEGSQSVKACALAFGFWHLSEFSRSYRSQFGETPSETLAMSKHRSL